MTRRFQTGVMVLALAAVAVGPVMGGVAWAGKKSTIKAVVNDAKFKVNRKPGATAAGGSYESLTGALDIVGGSAKLSGRGLNTTVELKVLSLSLLVPNLDTATFPLTVPVDLTTFSRLVNRGGTPVSTDIWGGEGVTLTITSYKNGRLKATFAGTIPPAGDTVGDAIVEKGKLSVLLNALAI